MSSYTPIKEGIKFKDQNHTFEPKQWVETYKNRDTSNKALINLLDDDQQIEEKDEFTWCDLPDLLLESIFSYLTIRERYYASLVCRRWYKAFYLPKVWSQFTMTDSTLTRARFNYYEGWQYVLDHLRVQMCLTQVGRNFRRLIFAPMMNFYNLYEFMNMISWYREQDVGKEVEQTAIGAKIKTLKYSFACDMSYDISDYERDDRLKLFGTGGKLLESLKRLMRNLTNLRRLELINLRLAPDEAQFLLDDLCDICGQTLKYLVLINATALTYQLLHVGVFLNLRVLVISPQNLGSEVLELLSFTNLEELYLYQNKYTTDAHCIVSVPAQSWKLFRKARPNISVHLELQTAELGRDGSYLVLQEGAPVKSILCDSPWMRVQDEDVMAAIELYQNDLEVYGHINYGIGRESNLIPGLFDIRKFDERADSSVVLLVRECRKLKTLIITEPISSATILMLTKIAKNLTKLLIRKRAVIFEYDWPSNNQFTDDYCKFLTKNCRSCEDVQKEVSNIFKRKWTMLEDEQMQEMKLDLFTHK